MKKFQTRLMVLLVYLCLIVVFLPVTALAAPPKVTFGDAWRNTRTEAQVEFTSDTTGEYYYAVTDPSVSMETPDIDTSGPGTPCTANETVTVTLEDVPTTSQCAFWLIVKGEDGTTSGITGTIIPEWDWWTLGADWILHIESNKGLTNWNNWLNSQDLFSQMWYKQSVVGVHIWKDVTNVDGGSFPASEYPNLAAYTVEDGNTAYSAEDGVLYNAEKTVLEVYPGAKSDADFAVPDTVVSIGYKAFYGNTKLKNITANEVIVMSQAFTGSAIETFSADAVKNIADWAFRNCKNLKEVAVSGGESFYINMNAFENCTSLTTFPFEKIDATNHSAFKGCSSLTEIQVPNRIEGSVFAGCTGLTEITIPSTVTYIGWDAFEGCSNLVSVTFESATPPEIAATGESGPFNPVAENFRFHVPEGSEDAYIEALGEDMAPYILSSDTLFYPLYVNGEQVRSDNLEIQCGDGTAVFDPDTNTLTLTNAEITKYGGKYGYGGAINSGLENLTIVLVGDNTIDTQGDSINTGMACNLVIKGDGILNTSGQLDLGREPSVIYDGNNDTGDLTIDGATVNVGSYLFIHHNLTFKNGATVKVEGDITANHQSTVMVEGATTSIIADGLSMGNGSLSDQTESKLVINDGRLTLRDGVAIPYPEDGDTNKYAIRFNPMGEGKIELNGGEFITESACKVTNALDDNITVANTLDIREGSWENGNIKIAAHELTLVPGKPATCTTDGIKAYYICSHCDKVFEDEDGVSEIKNLDTWKVIPATGHNPSSEWSSDETGHWHVCQNSGCTEKVDFAEHTPDHEGHATEGYAIKCRECGYIIEEQLDHTHVFDQEIATDAYKATDATCMAKATYYKSCVCGQKGTETFEYGELADHNPSSEWSSDETGHWHACQTSGCTEKVDFAEHTPDHEGHATEEYAIKCGECGYVIEEQLGHTHVFDQEIATDAYKATDATCMAKATYYKSCACGQKGTETFEYGELADHVWKPATCTAPKTCSVCGATEGSALGHTEGNEWKFDADNHWHVCTEAGCGVVIESSKAAHEFKWVTDKEATATENGSRHEECKICGYKKTSVEIPAIGTPEETGKSDGTGSPQTGDNSNPILWIAVLLVSGGLLGAVSIRKKNKSAKR